MSGPGHKLAIVSGGLVLAAWLAAYALTVAAARLPDEESGLLAAVFHPGTTPREAISAIASAGGAPVGQVTGWIWTVAGTEPGFVGRLKEQGMLLALRELPAGPTLAGCLGATATERLPVAAFR